MKMKKFPHEYAVAATGSVEGDLQIRSAGLPVIFSAPPVEFGGPGGRWSPETLLVAAVADCFILTFRAIAMTLELRWTSLHCDVRGTLDRHDGITQFTEFRLRAHLSLAPGPGAEVAQRALEKAERACLITNSLKAPVHFDAEVDVPSTPQVA